MFLTDAMSPLPPPPAPLPEDDFNQSPSALPIPAPLEDWIPQNYIEKGIFIFSN